MTPAETLALYRTQHRIAAEPINQYEFACATDHIRVYQIRGGGWRHDGYDIARLLQDQYGGETGRQLAAIERLVGLTDIRGDEPDYSYEDDRADYESQPEFSGQFRG